MIDPFDIAQVILRGFNKHYRMFREASQAAKLRFERADWSDVGRANRARISLYDERVNETVEALRQSLSSMQDDDSNWPLVKLAYIAALHESYQPECAETFYNSVVCRVLHRQYYKNDYIFWRPAMSTEHLQGTEKTYNTWYPAGSSLHECLLDAVEHYKLDCEFEDLERDIARVVERFSQSHDPDRTIHPNWQIHFLGSLFFRNKAAYIVGREINGHKVRPIVLPLVHSTRSTLVIDALITEEIDTSRLFSFSRAYFMVDMEVPSAYVQFLRSIMPVKPKLELYSQLGLQKYGKTLFYRDLHQHLHYSTDNFCEAPGIRGMVMMVFTMPSFHFVFKVIKDRFDPPKVSNRTEVKEKYQLVKNHDRVGRLADTLEYSDVSLPLDRFAPELIEALEQNCASSIAIDGDELVLRHVYIERRMIPLNEFMSTAPQSDIAPAIIEYGQAIRDLASANIFPGDMMLKNFGVTEGGRVVFYDYDEIVYMTECNFRRIPPTPPWMDDTGTEPWYSVKENDVFPEQFKAFFFADPKSREIFYEHHSDLIDPAYWKDRKQMALDHRLPDVFPYPASLRFDQRLPLSS